MKWTKTNLDRGVERPDPIDDGRPEPDVPLEQRIATYGKVISGLLQRHGDRIYALETQVKQLADK